MSQTHKDIRPFGLRDKIGYLFGDFGNDFTFIFASNFLMVFYTKVLHITPALVGTLFLTARFVDAVTDITMGRIVDTAKPAKDGRFRPWIRRMAGPVALASFLMYQSGMAAAPVKLRIAYMFVTYLLWGSIFYTSINIPYGSMASAITSDPDGRAALSTFRSVGASFAGLVVGMGVPVILYTTDANGNQLVVPERFTLIAGVFAVLAVLCYVLCYQMTTERVNVEPDPNRPRVTLGESFTAIVHNRALMAIIVAAILLLLSQLVAGSMANFLFIDYFKDPKAQSLFGLLGTVSVLALAPFAVTLSNRFGKKEAGAAATLIAAAAYFLLYALKLDSPYLFIAILVIPLLGQGLFNLIIWAFITDIIDYQEVKTNVREDGTVYAVYSFARKVGQALAGGIGGYALAAIGYNQDAAVQASPVLDGIYNVSTLVPAVAFLGVALVLIFWYPLNKKRVLANNAELKGRHEAGKSIDS